MTEPAYLSPDYETEHCIVLADDMDAHLIVQDAGDRVVILSYSTARKSRGTSWLPWSQVQKLRAWLNALPDGSDRFDPDCP